MDRFDDDVGSAGILADLATEAARQALEVGVGALAADRRRPP
jgi:hypothetical protein